MTTVVGTFKTVGYGTRVGYIEARATGVFVAAIAVWGPWV